jgi:hypothetical protein
MQEFALLTARPATLMPGNKVLALFDARGRHVPLGMCARPDLCCHAGCAWQHARVT